MRPPGGSQGAGRCCPRLSLGGAGALPGLRSSAPLAPAITHHRARASSATLRFQASLDGQTWQTLRRHQNDASLAETAMSTAAWPVDAGGQDYRHFRIFQTGQTSAGANHLMCAGIELYGRAKFERPPA